MINIQRNYFVENILLDANIIEKKHILIYLIETILKHQ